MNLLKKIVMVPFMLIGYILWGISGFVMLISGLCLFITLVTSLGVAFGCEAPNGIHPYMACFYFFVAFIGSNIVMYICHVLLDIDGDIDISFD